MKECRYIITNENYEKNESTWVYKYIDIVDGNAYSFTIDKEYNFLFNKNVDQKEMYLAYIDYVNNNCLDYFFRKLKLERVPQGYINLYEKLTTDNNAKVDKYIELALQNLSSAEELMDDINYESAQNYYTKISYLNQAQNALNKAKKLTRKK